MKCPHNEYGWCSRPDCWFIVNQGCAWFQERSKETTTDNTAGEPAPQKESP